MPEGRFVLASLGRPALRVHGGPRGEVLMGMDIGAGLASAPSALDRDALIELFTAAELGLLEGWQGRMGAGPSP